MKLEEILDGVRSRTAERAGRLGRPELERRAALSPVPRDFRAALTGSRPPRIIAEIKRASPSRGPIRPGLDPVGTARGYQEAGAAAISVLTESGFFRGSLADLAAVKTAVSLPVLQKEFILEEYQIFEGRAAGADAILLITAILPADRLAGLYRLSRDLGLAPLVEVHDERELETALALGAELIGINNRNLKSLEVNLETGRRLLSLIPPDRTAIIESGLKTREKIGEFLRLGARAFLIGESLLSRPDPAAALREMLT
ncbi:MAG TPA: indole-3-glycerol phosphate synthase TrpC [bacterium]|nr:indole-3-glycerol phosphate synthase TrpC [bacterium]HNS49234.1 indole-3-glycerol phosphate synthase TrpC [bacterium]